MLQNHGMSWSIQMRHRLLRFVAAVGIVAAGPLGCGGGHDAATELVTAREGPQALQPEPVVTTTGIIGFGTNLRPDGRFFGSLTPGAFQFPLNAAGLVAIHAGISDYVCSGCSNPGVPSPPRDGFLLSSDGVEFSFVQAEGPGFLALTGFALNDSGRLTYQRGPVTTGSPQQYQFFTQPAPYTTVSPYAPANAQHASDLHTNNGGAGVALVRTTDFSVPSVVRFDGSGGTQELSIDASYLLSAPLSRTKIFDDGTVYVGLLNYGTQRYEIWRFAGNETQQHTVVYSRSEGSLQAWDVNEQGTLVVAERTLPFFDHVVRTIPSGGPASVVEGMSLPSGSPGYTDVFINRYGVIAAIQATSNVLYAKLGGAATRVYGVGDMWSERPILFVMATSELSDLGQLTVFSQLDRTESNPFIDNVVVRLNPHWTPSIAGISPSSGPVGTVVTISGADFNGATAVTFNGVAARFDVVSPTQITATVPAGAATGQVAVTGPAGTGITTESFTVATVSAPSIASFSPVSGGVGSSVTIKGSGFASATVVRFNGVAATFKAKGGGQITATVPAGATTGPISIITASGTATSDAVFVVLEPPTIDAFSPSSGSPGTAVAISGSNFSEVKSVTFNGAKAAFTVLDVNTLMATVPKGAKNGPIGVSTSAGTVASIATFVVLK